MRETKYHAYLDSEERTILLHSLVELKNQLIQQGRYIPCDDYAGHHRRYRYYDFVNAETEEAFAEYVAKCKELALYDTGVSAEYGDKLITLSTCEYSAQNGRLVVVAKKVV